MTLVEGECVEKGLVRGEVTNVNRVTNGEFTGGSCVGRGYVSVTLVESERVKKGLVRQGRGQSGVDDQGVVRQERFLLWFEGLTCSSIGTLKDGFADCHQVFFLMKDLKVCTAHSAKPFVVG